MNPITKIFLFTLLFCFSEINSQENRVYFFGKIKDQIDFLPDAHIINLQTNQGTITNINGNFKILAKENDSIQITNVGYKTKTIRLKLSDFGIVQHVVVLEKETIQLDEIELNKSNLLGILAADSKLFKKKKEIDAESLNLPNAGRKKLTPSERRIYTATNGMSSPIIIHPLGITISVDYVLNIISGRLKRLRKIDSMDKVEIVSKNIKDTFYHYITKDLEIKDTDLNRFIYYTVEDPNFISEASKGEMNIIDFLKKKANQFKILNK